INATSSREQLVDAPAQGFVPALEPRAPEEVSTSDDFVPHDACRRAELCPREIDRTGVEHVPVVHDVGAKSVVHDAVYEIAAAEVLEHERGRTALATGGIAGLPVVDPRRVGRPGQR